MNMKNGTKINHLLQDFPKNVVVVNNWLERKGVYSQLVVQYVKNQWIQRIGHGAYKRTGDRVEWFGGVYALQTQLGMSVHPAAKTAVTLLGAAHYLPVSGELSKVFLFGGQKEKLPYWFKKNDWNIKIDYRMSGLFGKEKELGFTEYNCGNFSIKISSLERAAIEMCYMAETGGSFDELDKIMENLFSLRPDLVQKLLENCSSIKAKRLFMFFSERHNYDWVKDVSLDNVNFGSGKRALCKAGVYNLKYKIVIPEQFSHG